MTSYLSTEVPFNWLSWVAILPLFSKQTHCAVRIHDCNHGAIMRHHNTRDIVVSMLVLDFNLFITKLVHSFKFLCNLDVLLDHFQLDLLINVLKVNSL